MNVQLLAEHNLEFPSLKGGCTGLSESTLITLKSLECLNGKFGFFCLDWGQSNTSN